MSDKATFVRSQVIAMCAELGQDPLLVQGAGGNVSWKDGETLWVKASGTWLSDANIKDIFVPVDLMDLRQSIHRGEFNLPPKLLGTNTLKPSIETILHGLMPQKVVIHLHAIEILATLVRSEADNAVQALMPSTLHWLVVPYLKPGAELAEAVHKGLQHTPNADVVFLKNHGVVIGGESVKHVMGTLHELTSLFQQQIKETTHASLDSGKQVELALADGYSWLNEPCIANLALDPDLFNRLKRDWVLYPDHVVFLGPSACTVENWIAVKQHAEEHGTWPELVFIKGSGVVVNTEFSKAKREQLRCYGHIMARQSPHNTLDPLNLDQVGALLNWDAERYRVNLAK